MTVTSVHCYHDWWERLPKLQKQGCVLINWCCPSSFTSFSMLSFRKKHMFISASDWVWNPEMFTESTSRQMRPQKSNACMTQASECFCSSPHHWQHTEWQVQTQPSPGPAFLAPAAAAAVAVQRTLTRCWRVSVLGSRCWRETLLQRHWDGMIASEGLFVNCPCSNTLLLSGNIYTAITSVFTE